MFLKEQKNKTYLFFCILLLIRILFIVTYSPNTGGDSINYLVMLITGRSNLIHASGYTYFLGLPFRSFFFDFIYNNVDIFCYIIIVLQHLLSFCASILLFRGIARYHVYVAILATIFYTLYHGLLSANSQIYPEWLQANVLIILLIVLHYAIDTNRARRQTVWAFFYAIVIICFGYLVKYNFIYWASLWLLALLFIKKWTFFKKAKTVFLSFVLFSSLVLAYSFFIHKPTTGTMALSHDKAWVLLSRIGLVKTDIDPATGINTKRLIVLNSVLPWDNKNIYAINNISEVSPDIELYRQKYLHLLSADEQTLNQYLKTISIPSPYNFGYAWSPTSYYLGLPEGDALGVKVFLEHVIADPWLFIEGTVKESYTNLTNDSNYYLKFPIEIPSDAKSSGYGFFKLNLKAKLGIYYNTNYTVWAPGALLFKAFIFVEDYIFQNVLISLLLFVQFFWALAAYFKKAKWVGLDAKLIIILTILTFGFIVFSNAVFLFRADKELILVMPIICILLGNALVLNYNSARNFVFQWRSK